MIVGLGQSPAVAGELGRAAPVGRGQTAGQLRPLPGEPGEERGADIEGEVPEIVEQVADAGFVAHWRVGHGLIAFAGDLLVPVVVGRGAGLRLDHPQPGVLAGRLVEVGMDA